MATILETLQNAKHNLNTSSEGMQRGIGLSQLNNAVELLEKGYNLQDDIDELIEEFGEFDDIPDKR